jgi:hypothetical protein
MYMNGNEMIEKLREKFKLNKTDTSVATFLGMKQTSLQNWKNSSSITTTQMANLSQKIFEAGQREMLKKLIMPIVEFYPITQSNSKTGAHQEVLDTKTNNQHKKIKNWLEQNNGIYIFYGSDGCALYVGKTNSVNGSLWKRMNESYNTNKSKNVQLIFRVAHPAKNVEIYPAHEDKGYRQIKKQNVPLWELASYFSAYSVADSAIDLVEALLVRSFPNDLKNVKMENFPS